MRKNAPTTRCSRRWVALWSAAATTAGYCGHAQGAITWNPAVSNGSWSVSSNWLGGTLPLSTDNIYLHFNDALGHIITYDLGTFTSNLTLQVQNTGTGSTTLLIAGNNTLQVGTIVAGKSGSGVVDQQSGTISAMVTLGAGSGGAGTYLLSGSGMLRATGVQQIGCGGSGTFIQGGSGTHEIGQSAAAPGELYVGYYGGSGAYLLSGTGQLIITGQELIGVSSPGVFDQSGGTHSVRIGPVNSGGLYVGKSASGTYNLSGGTLSVFGHEIVGESAVGLFSQSDGTHTLGTTGATRDLSLGYLSTGYGRYTLSGGELSVTGHEYIGRSGQGSFQQSGGTHTIGSASAPRSLYLGFSSGAAGTYLLSGDGVLNVLGDETIGNNGTGLFDQSGGVHTIGTSASPHALTIAPYSAKAGTFLLSGGALTVTGYGNLGNSGPGLFDHSGGIHTIGSTSSPQPLYIGSNASGSGTYLLSGSGVLNVSGHEYVGYIGSGTFAQTGGVNNVGTTSAGRNLILSSNNLAAGSYLLGGGALNVSGGAGVGGDLSTARGSGVLSVSGGTATIAGTIKVWSAGSVNLSGGNVSLGTLDLSGNAARMNWTGGTLRINAFAPVGDGVLTVPGTGSLGGSGMIARATNVTPGGVLDPGSSIGTMTFTNDLTLQSSGSVHAAFDVQLGGTPDASNAGVTYDQLVISGSGKSFTVGGAVLRLVTMPGLVLHQPYQIVRTSGGATVNFATMFSNLVSGTNWSDAYTSWNVSYNTNSGIFVTFTTVPEPASAAGLMLLAATLQRRRRRR